MGRNETNFRDVTSKSGDFSPHIGKHTAERLTKFCKRTNRNRTRNIVKVCKGERKHTKGYTFRYIEESKDEV